LLLGGISGVGAEQHGPKGDLVFIMTVATGVGPRFGRQPKISGRDFGSSARVGGRYIPRFF